MRITTSGTADTRSPIMGMSIVEAASRDEAVEMLRGHHHLAWSDDCAILLLEEQAVPELGPQGPA